MITCNISTLARKNIGHVNEKKNSIKLENDKKKQNKILERESCRNQSKKKQYRDPLIKVPFLIDVRKDSRPSGYCYVYRVHVIDQCSRD